MNENTNIALNTILETLSLNPTTSQDRENEQKTFLVCIFCDHAEVKSKVDAENKPILQHLFMVHRLVIADVQEVLDLSEYLNFWKMEFKGL
jgi:hypothetical protein